MGWRRLDLALTVALSPALAILCALTTLRPASFLGEQFLQQFLQCLERIFATRTAISLVFLRAFGFKLLNLILYILNLLVEPLLRAPLAIAGITDTAQATHVCTTRYAVDSRHKRSLQPMNKMD